MSDAAEVINTVLNEDGRYIPKSIERDARTSRGLIPKLMRMVGKIPFADGRRELPVLLRCCLCSGHRRIHRHDQGFPGQPVGPW